MIRKATKNDIPQLKRIRESVTENVLADYSILTDELYMKHLTETGVGWVFELEGHVAGFAVADLKNSEVWALFVHPKYQGQGIGSALLHTMVEWMFTNGCRQITLSTGPGTVASRLYEKAGWSRSGIAFNGDIYFTLSR